MSHSITPRCTLCKACVEACPTQSIFLGDHQYVIDSDTCSDCQSCVPLCPVHAIQPIVPPKEEETPKTEEKPQPK